MTELASRTVIITGAASGIGRACAEASLADGAVVMGIDKDADGLRALAEAGAMTACLDVRERDGIFAAIEEARSATGRLDVLFNNAGYGTSCRIADHGPGRFEKMMAVHAFSAVYAIEAVVPSMRQQGYGRIINTISRGAESNHPGGGAYAAAKAALWAISRVTAAEEREHNILVNALIPGPTNSAIWGRDRPELQGPEAVIPTFTMLATLPDDGPTGQVFWNEKVYPLFLNTLGEGASLDEFAVELDADI